MKQNRKELLDKAYNLAYKYEAERGSCPQCVTAAILETLDIGDEKIIQAADGLAGGTALSTEGTCGALVGGLMAISIIVGRTYEDFSKGERRRRVFQYSKKLYDKFIEEYGSLICKDIHQKLFGRTFKLLDPKEYKEFEEAGAHVDKCPSVSGNVARWTAEIILDDLKK
ncbi:MAG: C_GCAxxG_C_C family protein [Thermoplasmatales archaeon]|nr:MAG: C_GCAxxG_C_C family protein [Thermoplasmatales archaeon]